MKPRITMEIERDLRLCAKHTPAQGATVSALAADTGLPYRRVAYVLNTALAHGLAAFRDWQPVGPTGHTYRLFRFDLTKLE